MASVTFKFVQGNAVRDDGTGLVMLRITYQRQIKHLGTGVYVPPKYFNPDGTADKQNWVRKSHPQASSLNGTLRAWWDRGQRVLPHVAGAGPLDSTGPAPGSARLLTAADIKARLETPDSAQVGCLAAYIEAEIRGYKARGQESSARASTVILTNLRAFLGVTPADPVPFGRLTKQTLDAFETWLIHKPRQRRTSDAKRRNTASGYLERLHGHIRRYVIDRGLPDAADPLRGRSFSRAPVDIVRLSEAELDHWLATPIPNPENRRSVARLEHVRLLFFCSYGLQGIRAGDLISARVGDLTRSLEMHPVTKQAVWRWRFAYTSNKRDLTKHILVSGPVLSILQAYCAGREDDPGGFIFPFLRDAYRHYSEAELFDILRAQVSDCDRLLKRVCAYLGITKHVTMHTARHSFAEHLLDATGELKTLQNALGHGDVSTSQKYTSRMKQTRVDRGNVIYERWEEDTGT